MPYISLFDGTNYEYWSLKMETYFKSMDLWDVVEKGIPQEPTHETPPPSSSSTTTKEEGEQWWVTKDSYALNIIQSTITKDLFPWIACAKTSKEAWEILLVLSFGGPMFRNRILVDLKKYYKDIAMGDFETVHEFIGRFFGIVFRMKSYGWKVQDQELVKKILASLSPRFDKVIVEIAETLSISELIDCLLVHEYNMMMVPVQDSDDDEESFVEVDQNGDVEESTLQGDQGRQVLSLLKHNQKMLIQLQRQMAALMQ